MTSLQKYGRCSFVLPEGFLVQEKASQEAGHPSCSLSGIDEMKAPLCVTLTSTAVHPDAPVFSVFAEDMAPEAYPEHITITSRIVPDNTCPLQCLREAADVLRKYYTGFRVDFCEKSRVGVYQAAIEQCSFVTNFTIFQLHIAWVVDKELLTGTMMVSKPGLERGWKKLRQFVDSIRLE